MKKITLLFFYTFFFFLSTSFSQLNKGTILLGGDVSYNTQSSTNGPATSKTENFTFSPTIAVAVKKNVFWGGSVLFSSINNKPAPVNAFSKHNSYGADLFFRKYKLVKNKFYVFIEAGLSYGIAKEKFRQNPDYFFDSKRITTGLNISPGVSLAVSKKLYLESGFNNIAHLGYQHNKTEGYNFGNVISLSSSNFGLSSRLRVITSNLYFGFRFMLDRNNG